MCADDPAFVDLPPGRYEKYKATSLAQFIEITTKVNNACDARHQAGKIGPYHYLWWRGQSSAAESLLPGLYRDASVTGSPWRTAPLSPDADVELMQDFRRRAGHLVEDRGLSDLEWYFLMQHHGLPTRLLDWTESALIALHFALRQRDVHRAAAVWGFDHITANAKWHNKRYNYALRPSEGFAKLFAPRELRDNSGDARYRWPLALMPPPLSSRLSAQLSRFTVHGTEKHGIEAISEETVLPDGSLHAIVIPCDAREALRRELRGAAGVMEDLLFPDLGGLVRAIRDEYDLWSSY